MRRDLGVPWIFGEQVVNSPFVALNVEIDTGLDKGFFYCYQTYSESAGLYEILPNLQDRTAQIRVDGQPVWMPEPKPWNVPPQTFFENDRYVYQTSAWAAWP